VCWGIKEPHAIAPHVTLQSAPSGLTTVPSVTVAEKLAAAPAEIDAGGVCANAMATVGSVMVAVTMALWVGSATEVAVKVTVPPDGTEVGEA
jgi:hypothetical protein